MLPEGLRPPGRPLPCLCRGSTKGHPLSQGWSAEGQDEDRLSTRCDLFERGPRIFPCFFRMLKKVCLPELKAGTCYK